MAQTLTVIDTIIVLVYLNEFYLVNKTNYLDYLRRLDNTAYRSYQEIINQQDKFPSLLHLFGIYHHNNYTDYISFFHPIEQAIYRERQGFKQYISREGKCWKFKLVVLNKNIESLQHIDWIIWNLDIIKKSSVFSYRQIGDSLDIIINLAKVKIGQNPSIWQKIYSRVIGNIDTYKYPIYLVNNSSFNLNYSMDMEFSIYPVDKLTNRNWKIESSLEEIMMCCHLGRKIIESLGIDDKQIKLKNLYDVLLSWFKKMDWLRKRNYIMTLYLISKQNKKKGFYCRYFYLPDSLRWKILQYI